MRGRDRESGDTYVYNEARRDLEGKEGWEDLGDFESLGRVRVQTTGEGRPGVDTHRWDVGEQG